MATLCTSCLHTIPTNGRCPNGCTTTTDHRPPGWERYPREYRANREAILPGPCHWCGTWVTTTTGTADHLTPRSQGGGHGLDNLVPCCRSCNFARGDRPADTWQSPHARPPDPTTALCNREQVSNARPIQARTEAS